YFLPAQSLTPSAAFLNFGDTFDNQVDSLSLLLSNPHPYSVRVNEIRFYQTYTQTDFRASSSDFDVPPGGQTQIWVYFQPRHNITYNSEMLILTDSRRGALSINLRGVGKYSDPYYNSLANKDEQSLKTALSSLLAQGFVQQSYNAARDEMFMVIDNQKINGQGASSNQLEGVYTGLLIDGFNNRAGAQNMGFNTEHVFPQSLFSSNLPMRSDIHHLFPTNSNANSQRGNLAFGTVSNPSWQEGGSKKGNNRFEPRDEHKGEIARAMMYFVLRYQDYSNFFAPQTTILRQWHRDFPPVDIARKRNDDIEAVQGNRNPFVDYPQLEERITNFSGNSQAPTRWALDRPDGAMVFDTVGFPTQAYYEYPLINHGNQSISLTQLSFRQGAFQLISGTGNPASIEPGEAITLQIRPLSGMGEIQDTLQINTNIPGEEQINVPISAFFDSSNRVEDLSSSFASVRYLPLRGTLVFYNEQPLQPTHFQLLDLKGQTCLQGHWQEGVHEVSLDALAAGLYLLRLRQGEQWQQQKLWIQ
ncbi:MAG: endonuclease, partial [Bacteroidota bacterium]